MPSKGYKTVSMKITLLDELQKVANDEGKSRSELMHEVLWAYIKIRGVV